MTAPNKLFRMPLEGGGGGGVGSPDGGNGGIIPPSGKICWSGCIGY